MKHFKVSINVDDGLNKRTYTTYVEAQSESEAKSSIMSYFDGNPDSTAEITEITEVQGK